LVAFLKVFLIILVIVILGPIQYVFITFKVKYKAYIPQLFHKIILKVLGVKVKLIGKKTTARPLVLIGNHTSYLDIIILGSIMPICFIAKEEIRSWFLFGFLAKMQNTIFIKRKNFKTKQSLDYIKNQLSSNSAIVLFPEGTTNTGKRVLSFKSSLFNLFENNNILRLQNFSLCYTHVNTMPIDNRTRPQISWYGDMNIVSHLSNLLKFSCINTTVVFHPMSSIKNMSRKAIAISSINQVIKGKKIALDNL
tara:strand:+ start:29 stop:781 length:753 start_codon:yes stop_codon:yes gene_type:complete